MIKLTNLEAEVIVSVLEYMRVGGDLIDRVQYVGVESREFSSVDTAGYCSGFYTKLTENSLLGEVRANILTSYCVQARCEKLKSGEMGFYVFCDPIRKSVDLIEGFFYGDERLLIEEMTKSNHSFAIYEVG